MFDNIVSHRDRFEKSSKKSARVTGTFDPWRLVEGYVYNIIKLVLHFSLFFQTPFYLRLGCEGRGRIRVYYCRP